MNWRLRAYPSLASTSDLCATLAVAGEPAGLAIRADRQTHGRGSRGRTWETLPGNLALSVLLRPDTPASAAGLYALMAAVALAEALEAHGAPPIRLKWPNDLLLDGKKLGGILLDSALRGHSLDWLVIGFGANLAAAPNLSTATRLPTPPDPHQVAQTLLDRLTHWTEEPSPLARGQGEAPASPRRITQAWLARGPALGTHLRLNLPTGAVAGTFAGLGDGGALLLQTGGRVHAFSTGDVLQGA